MATERLQQGSLHPGPAAAAGARGEVGAALAVGQILDGFRTAVFHTGNAKADMTRRLLVASPPSELSGIRSVPSAPLSQSLRQEDGARLLSNSAGSMAMATTVSSAQRTEPGWGSAGGAGPSAIGLIGRSALEGYDPLDNEQPQVTKGTAFMLRFHCLTSLRLRRHTCGPPQQTAAGGGGGGGGARSRRVLRTASDADHCIGFEPRELAGRGRAGARPGRRRRRRRWRGGYRVVGGIG